MTKLILDASILISWIEELEKPIIFNKLLEAEYEIVIPQNVIEEVDTNNSITEDILNNSKIIKCDKNRHEELSNRYFRLGDGELAVLTLGEKFDNKNKEYFCCLDDGRAREACEKIGLNLKGTLGILGKLIEREKISFRKADKLIKEAKEAGTYLPENHKSMLRSIAND